VQADVPLEQRQRIEDESVPRCDDLLDSEQPSTPFRLGHAYPSDVLDLDTVKRVVGRETNGDLHGLFVDDVLGGLKSKIDERYDVSGQATRCRGKKVVKDEEGRTTSLTAGRILTVSASS
jgi:hypothetical protein